jgi:hypothetical protein
MSNAEECLFGLGMVGGDATIPEIRFQLGGDLDRHQIRCGLAVLARRRPPMAELAVRGRRGSAHPGVWRLTAAGRAWLDAECGEDDEPVRVPCGLGWPVSS